MSEQSGNFNCGSSGASNKASHAVTVVLYVLLAVLFITGIAAVIVVFADNDDPAFDYSGIYVSYYGHDVYEDNDGITLGFSSETPIEFTIFDDELPDDFDYSGFTVSILSNVTPRSSYDFDIYLDASLMTDEDWTEFFSADFWFYYITPDYNKYLEGEFLMWDESYGGYVSVSAIWQVLAFEAGIDYLSLGWDTWEDVDWDYLLSFYSGYDVIHIILKDYYGDDFDFALTYNDFWTAYNQNEIYTEEGYWSDMLGDDYGSFVSCIADWFIDNELFEDYFWFSDFDDFTCVFSLDGSDLISVSEDGTFSIKTSYIYLDSLLKDFFSLYYGSENYLFDFSDDTIRQLNDFEYFYIHIESPDGEYFLDIPFTVMLKSVVWDSISNFDPDGDFIPGDTYFFYSIHNPLGETEHYGMDKELNSDGFYDWFYFVDIPIISSGEFGFALPDGWYDYSSRGSSSDGSFGDNTDGQSQGGSSSDDPNDSDDESKDPNDGPYIPDDPDEPYEPDDDPEDPDDEPEDPDDNPDDNPDDGDDDDPDDGNNSGSTGGTQIGGVGMDDDDVVFG